MTLHVTLPDGSPLELADGATVYDAATAIGPRLAKAAVAGRVTAAVAGGGAAGAAAGPRLVDVGAPLHDGDTLSIVTLKADDPESLEVLRHTASHVMAQAVLRLWPGAKYSIGPAIENGFYYDFQLPEPIAEDDLARIEAEMAKIVAEDHATVRAELPADEALALFGAGGGSLRRLGPQPFKVELIEDLVAAAAAEGRDVPTISVYTQGEFVDLCRGPHLPATGRLGKDTFKLTSVAGAYWRGDERNADAHARLRHRLPERRRSCERISRPSSWPASAITAASAATSTSSASTRRAPASPSSTPRACASGTR